MSRASDAATGQGSPPAERARTGTAVRVLVVDDDPLTAAAHVAMVNRVDGFHAGEPVHSAGAALAALRATRGAERPRLVLLDLTLPDATGLDVARALRGAGDDVAIIAVTAVRDAAAVRQAIALGVGHYLIKPFGFAALRERLLAYRDYAERSLPEARTDQSSVDAAFAALHRPARTAPPKGLSGDTLDAAARALRRAGAEPRSAAALAAELGVSRVTARRYLEHLVDTGAAVRRSRHGAPGRPLLEYAAVDTADIDAHADALRTDADTDTDADADASTTAHTHAGDTAASTDAPTR
ncbi:response regulator [Mycetocola reblochoni]|uniref:Putative two-component system response regulator n=1 Tax=Mycetocola reblochoni REB411 TaxID=1255698 RepID=A0A1R4JWP6_9MICO|nr:putative two-component system response regulator [Mycetocola reblochoni REB411]